MASNQYKISFYLLYIDLFRRASTDNIIIHAHFDDNKAFLQINIASYSTSYQVIQLKFVNELLQFET